MPAYLLLQRGKKSVTIDLTTPAGHAQFQRLVLGFDVVVEDWGPGRAEAAGIGYADLSSINPALVGCSITGFGNTGPFAHVAADDALVMAKAGIFRDQPGWERDGKRPIYRSCPDGSYFAGMLAVQGILAALRARADRTRAAGRHQHAPGDLLPPEPAGPLVAARGRGASAGSGRVDEKPFPTRSTRSRITATA